MRRRMLGAWLSSLAAALLQACGGQGSDGAAIATGALTSVAEAFRHEGVLLGANALDERFGGDGVRIADALEMPEDLPRFLAASRAVVVCDGKLPAIVYVSPLYRALLVTRWSIGGRARLESVHAIPAPPSGEDAGPAAGWLEALPDAESAAALLEARYREALVRARDDALCARTRERSARAAPLIADAERDTDLYRVADPSERVGEIHRALERLLTDGDTRPLEALGFSASVDALERLPAAKPAVFPVPVSALAAGPVALVLYADLNVPGRYLLLGQVHGRLGERHVDATGRLELIALPAEP